jgi:hypothetical protein
VDVWLPGRRNSPFSPTLFTAGEGVELQIRYQESIKDKKM